MQTTKYIPNKPYIINWDRNTIDLDGIVDSIGLDTFFVDEKIPILFADSSKIAAKIAKLKQVCISSTDNAMKNVFDSNYVYIPLTFSTNKGDTISVHNYSASVFLDCSSQYTVPYVFLWENFPIIRHRTSLQLNIFIIIAKIFRCKSIIETLLENF